MGKVDVRVGDLVFDDELLELRKVNKDVVTRYANAMRMGEVFPDIIFDEETKTIVAGNHRVCGYLREYGEDHIITGISRKFANRADMIKVFVETNTTHGLPLDGISKNKIVAKLIHLSVDVAEISKLLNIPVKNVQRISQEVVSVRIGKAPKKVQTPTVYESKPVKRNLDHMVRQGLEMTEEQYAEHMAKDLGVNLVNLVEQVNRHLRNDWVDRESDKTFEALRELYELLGEWF